jgi:heparanase 1
MLITGPGSVAEGVSLGSGSLPGMLKTMDLLAATPRPAFDIFSYHFYGAVSMRCAPPGGQMAGTTPDAALSDEWLSRSGTVYAFYAALRDQFSPGTPMWLTETADAACGGNPWGATFLDTFRYVDQLGRLATRGVKTVFHNTLAASEYGLIDEHSMTPRPNYWAAVLWHRLMGATVLDAGASKPGLHVYAHCLPGHRGGVTLLAINTTRTSAESIDLPITADRYSLAAGNTDFTQATLNGRELVMQPNGLLPTLNGARIVAGPVELAPASITFLAMAEAGNPSCR